jgi:hypothetical protein
VIVGFTPKVGPCIHHAVCVGGQEGKKFGKIFSFFKRGENIVKGCMGEGEIRMSFVLLSVMILKLESLSF